MKEDLLRKIEDLERKIGRLEQSTMGREQASSSRFNKSLKKRIRISLAVAFSLAAVGLVMAADVPHNFGTGGVISATKFNENFSYIVDRLWDKNGSELYYNEGDVGIGTTSPDAKLEIAGHTRIRGSAVDDSFLSLYGFDFGATGRAGVNIVSGTSGTSEIAFGYEADPDRSRIVSDNTDNSLAFYTNNTERVKISYTGNVGILVDPLWQLTVNDQILLSSNAGEGDSILRMVRDVGSGWNQYWDFRPFWDSNYLQIGYNGGNTLAITESSRVGIGTTEPDSILHVKGSSPQLKIETTGSVPVTYHVGPNAADGSFRIAESAVADRIVIAKTTGNVGIGTSLLGAKLNVVEANANSWAGVYQSSDSAVKVFLGISDRNGDAAQDYGIWAEAPRAYFSGNVGIGTTVPNYTLDVRGTVGNNTTTHHSDRRWKRNIEPLEYSLEKVTNLRGVSFEWRRDEFQEMNFSEDRHIGVVAQEVEKVLPELVHTGNDGFKSVEYANMVPMLIEAIKEQQNQIEELKNRIRQIEAQNQ
ncbi:MAG: tail fiber domain-containing protein [Proteobacteria bacterium]|nr:tail fiber domain-containing protein [Pseudomonadota bacterium]